MQIEPEKTPVATAEYPYGSLGEESISLREICGRVQECFNHPWMEPIESGAIGSEYTQAGVDFTMLVAAPAAVTFGVIVCALLTRKLMKEMDL